MPLNIQRSDRRLLIWAGAILLPLIAAIAVLSDNEEESTVPSTYSAQASGAKAAYLLLEEQGYKLERWTRSPLQLPQDAAGTVYVLAGPWGTPKNEEKTPCRITSPGAEESWPLATRLHVFCPRLTWSTNRPRPRNGKNTHPSWRPG
jgi:hypothetical protein